MLCNYITPTRLGFLGQCDTNMIISTSKGAVFEHPSLTKVAQQSMTKILALTSINFVTP